MKSEETTIWKAMIKTPASMVLIIYTFISMWFVGGLTAFHLYLISTNQVITLSIFKINLAILMYLQLHVVSIVVCGRLHMRTSDTDMIDGQTHITKG